MLSYSAEKHSIVVAAKKVGKSIRGKKDERMENRYEERNIKYSSNTKQVFSVLKDYTEKRTTLCCEFLLLIQLK